jgi:hypothetical protein
MGRRPRVTSAIAGCAALSVLAACHRSASPDGPAPSSSAAALRASPQVPADHLAPGELLEGTDKAFGITLPRGLRVDGAFIDAVYASGLLDVHPLTTYLAARLQNGDMREGATSATFERVNAKDNPARMLTIHIAKVGDGTRVDFRDVTPAPPPNLPDEAARWRHVGLTPSGRLLDPTHLD